MVKLKQNLMPKITKEKSDCYCLAAVVLDTVCKLRNEDDRYYPQNYLEE